MFWPFKKKTIEKHLNEIRKVKIHHMDFIIKKINVLDHCTGAKVCAAIFSTYQIVSDQNKIEEIWSRFNFLVPGIIPLLHCC